MPHFAVSRGKAKNQRFDIRGPAAAAHLLSQASLGPTWPEIQEAMQSGTRQAWLAEQLIKPLPRSFFDRVRYDHNLGLDPFISDAVKGLQAFWTGLVKAPPLRGKCLKSLMRIFVMSERAGGPALGDSHSLALWLDRLNANVFGNYKDLLASVTYSPQMSYMLSHYANSKAVGESQPDENYAREIMQLFTIGLWQLNLDGSRVLVNGNPVPTYDNTDIQQMAKVFTGLTRDDRPDAEYLTQSVSRDNQFRIIWPRDHEALVGAMTPLYKLRHYAGFYDTTAKVALGGLVNIPANTPGPQNLDMVHTALVNHPSCAPFVCKRLIQTTVCSTPSPGYIERVASVFSNNGSGVVGDMKAIWTAIFTDEEALQRGSNFVDAGRVKDGIEVVAHTLRSLDRVRTDGWNYIGSAADTYFGVELFREPSIFGFFDLTTNNLELNQWTSPNAVGSLNRLYDLIINGEPRDTGTAFPKSEYTSLPPLAATPQEHAERLNLLFCGGQMSPGLRADIIDTMNSLVATTDSLRMDRIWAALQLVMASTEFRTQL